MKKLSVKSVLFRVIVLVMAVLFVFVISKINYDNVDDMKQIYGSFVGKKSLYNGIIEVWNVDSFESGLKSKVSFLESSAKRFQKENKGVYVMVRNFTVGECLNSLESGTIPDVISCSYGVCEKIRDYLVPFEIDGIEIYDNFLNAGKSGDDLYGLAWCAGFYSLISTKAKLEKSGCDFKDVKLNEIAFDVGYKYKIGKKEKESKSIVFGEGEYLMPKNALKAYNKARSIQIKEDVNEELKYKSQYSAYTSFLSNDATILLGTHRDVYRMMGREEKGSVSDVVYLPLMEWSDLVQFSFLCKNNNETRKKIAEKFAKFLTQKNNQEKLEEIGMFPVCGVESVEYKGVMSHITLEKFSNCELKNVF